MSRSGATLFQIRGLTVSYRPKHGRAFRAIEAIDLEIGTGEILGLLGESGCGKSTLAAALLRLLPPHATYETGGLLFQGRDLLRLTERDMCEIRGKRISLIWQDPALALNPVLSVGNQIAEVLRAHVRLSGQELQARVQELLAEVGFSQPGEVYSAYPHQLSGGQRQRMVIAQAIACRPALVIADEATSKLDATLQKEILDLFSDIRRRYGTAWLVISHDPDVIAQYADRIAVMYAGRLVEEASVAEIFASPLHPYTEALLRLGAGQRPRVRRLPVIDGEAPELSQAKAGCRFEPRCGEKMAVCASCDPQESSHMGRRVSCFKYAE